MLVGACVFIQSVLSSVHVFVVLRYAFRRSVVYCTFLCVISAQLEIRSRGHTGGETLGGRGCSCLSFFLFDLPPVVAWIDKLGRRWLLLLCNVSPAR